MESKGIFGASDTTKAHVGADTDESFDSLHHTVGKGSTQAAAGNHKHAEYVLVGSIPGAVTDHGALQGLGDDDHPQYVLAAGDTMGHLQIDHSLGITLHYPQNSVVSMMPRLEAGQYVMYFLSQWDYSVLAPLQIGTPINGNSAARVDWVDANYANWDHGHAGLSTNGSAVIIPDGNGQGIFGTGSAYVGAPVICNGDFQAHQRAASILSWDNNGTISFTNTNPGQNIRINFHVNVT